MSHEIHNAKMAKNKEEEDIQTTSKTLALKAPKIATSLQRLRQIATNLNHPPDNWLRSTPFDNLEGFTTKESKFSSLKMAFDHLHMNTNVDVVTAANNIKKLLTIALTNSQGLSMFVHPVGQSLLIDNFDIHKWLLNPQPEWKWFREFVFQQISDPNKALMRKSHTNDALVERNWMSKFLYYTLHEEDFNRVLPAKKNSISVEEGSSVFPSLPEPEEMLKKEVVDEEGGPLDGLRRTHLGAGELCIHARTLLWSFKDLKMLIGSDMPIFGDKDHPSVSLKLVNVKKPINILTGLDYWLDNLMCQVPEVLMCFHDEGIVKNYEFFKTEDLPNISPNAHFNADSVMHVAINILAFLKRNATKEGHTYWLFKRKNDNMVKLYDLTSLCEANPEATSEDKAPFQDAVSMLLYKLARNIIRAKRSESKLPFEKDVPKDMFEIGDEDAIARRALNNCLKLLDKEKYPQIAASASYLLSDVYIPDNTNPLCPNFKKSENSSKKKKKEKKKAKKSGKKENSFVKMTTVEELRNAEEDDFEGEINQVEPLPWDVEERCLLALEHIRQGLESVKFLQLRKDEMEQRQRKEREQHERDNPKMCRPMEPIPMPYKTEQINKVEKYESKEKPHDWHDNLKALLLRKAFLVYVILAEAYFNQENYGKCVKSLKKGLNCYFCLKNTSVKALLSFAYGVAGDAFMILSERWDKIYVKFHEGFNLENNEVDKIIAEVVEDCVHESHREWSLKVPRNIEEALNLALKCFRSSIEVNENVENFEEVKEAHDNLKGRFANALNVTATLYIRKATSFLESHLEVQETLSEAVKFLEEGLEIFVNLDNWMNSVILATNAGMAYRTWAFALKGQVSGELEMHEKALGMYKKAYLYAQDHPEMADNAGLNLMKTFLHFIKTFWEDKDREDFLAPLKHLDLLTDLLETSKSEAVDKLLLETLSVLFWNLGHFKKSLKSEKFSFLVSYLESVAFKLVQECQAWPEQTFLALFLFLTFKDETEEKGVEKLQKTLADLAKIKDCLPKDLSQMIKAEECQSEKEFVDFLVNKKHNCKTVPLTFFYTHLGCVFWMKKTFKEAYAEMLSTRNENSKDALKWLKSKNEDLVRQSKTNLKLGNLIIVESGELVKIMIQAVQNYKKHLVPCEDAIIDKPVTDIKDFNCSLMFKN